MYYKIIFVWKYYQIFTIFLGLMNYFCLKKSEIIYFWKCLVQICHFQGVTNFGGGNSSVISPGEYKSDKLFHQKGSNTAVACDISPLGYMPGSTVNKFVIESHEWVMKEIRKESHTESYTGWSGSRKCAHGSSLNLRTRARLRTCALHRWSPARWGEWMRLASSLQWNKILLLYSGWPQVSDHEISGFF